MKKFRQALVLGLGASGESAALLLAREGVMVTVLDEAVSADLRVRAGKLKSQGVAVNLGSSEIPSGSFEVCVVSPGISVMSKVLQEVQKRGVPVLPEFELGWSRHRGRTVAVTGTNGKSTVVKWIAETLNKAGEAAVACGNYGYPVCGAVAQHQDAKWLVIEASSFQLETAAAFRPDVGVLLNLMPNHLDRHASMDDYAAAKARMFAYMIPTDTGVVHEPLLPGVRARSGANARWVSFGETPAADYFYRAGAVFHGGAAIANLQGTYFGNEVLGSNAAGAIAALEACGVAAEIAGRTAREFQPLPHRMQVVRTLEGIDFVDDSKATTLAALSAGLRMCRGHARLIAGGLLKENDLVSTKKVLAEKASAIYLIGQASETMFKAWSGCVSCFDCVTLERALELAWRDAREGETVLLSPGCASFDQFRSYAERGDRFGALVVGLTGRNDRGK